MTIPGFSSTPIPIQNHIHLGFVPRDGSNPIGFTIYGEPPYQFGHVNKRTPHYEVISSFGRAWDGTPLDHTLSNSNGTPKVFTDIQYSIRCSAQDIDLLARLVSGRVYLVDTRHCADQEDHTSYVRVMYFADLTYDEAVVNTLQYNNITLVFKDMSTVSGL